MTRLFITAPRGGRRVGDWIKLRTGDQVYDIADERHIGRVEAVRSSAFVTVRWLETGWISELPIEQVQRVRGISLQ